MLWTRTNRSSPEKIYIAVKNSYSTAAITVGQAVNWDFVTDADGVSVTMPLARATNGGFAGAGIVADASIGVDEYGLIQVFGYHSSTRVRTVTGGSPAITPGRPLVMNVAGSVFCLESTSTASTVILRFPVAFSFGSTAGFTTIAKPVFLKFI